MAKREAPTGALGVAALAALFASIGDLGLLWVANASRPELALPAPPGGTLWLGGLLGVLGIPLYGLGYRALAGAVGEPGDTVRRWVAWSGAGFAGVGALVHGLTARLVAQSAASGAPAGDPLAAVAGSGALLAGSWLLATLLLVATCAPLALALARGRSPLPLWLGVANPVVLTLALGAAGLADELLRAFLVPAAPNLAHALFFAAASRTSSANASRRSSIRSQTSGTRSRHEIKPKSS
jgi:amino acid transporter